MIAYKGMEPGMIRRDISCRWPNVTEQANCREMAFIAQQTR